MPALTVQDLVAHMKKYNDALVVMGPGSGLQLNKPDRAMLEENYSAKVLRREPEKFWPFFKEHIFIDPAENNPTPAQEGINTLRDLGVIGKIISQTTDGAWEWHYGAENVIELHGNCVDFVCMNPGCKIHYGTQYVMSLEQPVPTCEVCGKNLRPNILLFGEKYREDRYDSMKQVFLNTHTLILVGADFTEDPVMELVAGFVDMKTMINSQSTDNQRMAVVISPPDNYDVNEEIGFFEFIVRGDTNAATERLVKAFKS